MPCLSVASDHLSGPNGILGRIGQLHFRVIGNGFFGVATRVGSFVAMNRSHTPNQLKRRWRCRLEPNTEKTWATALEISEARNHVISRPNMPTMSHCRFPLLLVSWLLLSWRDRVSALPPNYYLGTCLDAAWVTSTETSKHTSHDSRESDGRLTNPFMQAALQSPRYTVGLP